MYLYPKGNDFVFNFAFILEGGQRPLSKILGWATPTPAVFEKYENLFFSYIFLPYG